MVCIYPTKGISEKKKRQYLCSQKEKKTLSPSLPLYGEGD
jgi:hypothetical protein